jgi:hypothetical protein
MARPLRAPAPLTAFDLIVATSRRPVFLRRTLISAVSAEIAPELTCRVVVVTMIQSVPQPRPSSKCPRRRRSRLHTSMSRRRASRLRSIARSSSRQQACWVSWTTTKRLGRSGSSHRFAAELATWDLLGFQYGRYVYRAVDPIARVAPSLTEHAGGSDLTAAAGA